MDSVPGFTATVNVTRRRQVRIRYPHQPRPAPSSIAAITSLRKCMPSKMRETAMLKAQNRSGAASCG